ncbi:helix-turn-helix transcriptional regulator [Nucisporomicrobium flavum]|uniref:helix-turn-helix transcriptional regulator n=1 Tax=Nucisporomicrobium flavum TaxID=2785915 RepID=UPI0018F73E89|nr:helix-turn-helix transcriptional regulator [Nucisporomicrobium flavum]
MNNYRNAADNPAVRALARQLVAALTAERPDGPPMSPEPGDLLDLEVDGVRCRCVRVAPPPGAPRAALSPREQEIARMVAKGRTNQAIADVLGISTWTVSTHLRRIFAKLNVNSRAAMVAGLLTAVGGPPSPAPRGAVSSDPVTPEDATHVRGSREGATTGH